MPWQDVYRLPPGDIFEKAKKYSVTATQRQVGPLFAYGFNAYLWDRDGKKYIDFISKISQGNVGHDHQEINNTICDFIGARRANLSVNSNVTYEGTKLQEILCEITPGNFAKKVLFKRGGTNQKFLCMISQTPGMLLQTTRRPISPTSNA